MPGGSEQWLKKRVLTEFKNDLQDFDVGLSEVQKELSSKLRDDEGSTLDNSRTYVLSTRTRHR